VLPTSRTQTVLSVTFAMMIEKLSNLVIEKFAGLAKNQLLFNYTIT
jgi:hypothetical protein